MTSPYERILAVAQRLDEMVEEGPSELTTLSEELGLAVAALEDAPKPNQVVQSRPQPRWAQELRRFVEQAALEILDERYGEYSRGYDSPNDPYMTLRIPRNDYRYSGREREYDRQRAMLEARRYTLPTMDPKDALKGLGIV